MKDPFDWYQRWVTIKDLLVVSLRKTDLILNAGAGISRLAEEMYDDGFERIISVDVCPAAVKLMNDKCRHKKDEFKYDVMDIKNLTFEDSKFDVVIDKATLDCFFVKLTNQGGNDSVDTVHAILKQYYRVLKPKGTLIVISYGLPDKRLKHFRHPNFKWEVRVDKVIKLRQASTEEHEVDGGPEPEYHYIYTCVKVFLL